MFGGSAFKYQWSEDNLTTDSERLIAEARRSEARCHVVTTSGPGIEREAKLEKIKTMKAAITKPLAMASGVNIDNVRSYLPYIDCFLVATGISKDDESDTLDPEKVKQLAEIIHIV